MPMNDEYSLLPTSEFAALVRKVIKQEKLRRPKETTILLLKDFARNYRANKEMPEGLQGYLLS